MTQTKVKLSDQHYLLDGLVYLSTLRGNSPLSVMAAWTKSDEERLAFATRFKLVLPGTPGTVVGTTSVNGTPRFAVQFEGVDGTVPVSGQFISKVE